MSKHHIRLLLWSAMAVALIVGAVFVVEWFTIHLGLARVTIDLRQIRACAPDEGCNVIALSRAMSDVYTVLASIALWGGVVLGLLVISQCVFKLFTGIASPLVARVTYSLGSTVAMCAFVAGYFFGPDESGPMTKELFRAMSISVERTWAPLMLVGGSAMAMIAARYSLFERDDDDVGKYTPVVIAKPEPRPPITALAAPRVPQVSTGRIERIITPPGQPRLPHPVPQDSDETRSTSPTQPPVVARTDSSERAKPPSQPPSSERTKSPSPPDQIPVAPESGLVIRKRTASAGPVTSPEARIAIRSPSPSHAPPGPIVPPPLTVVDDAIATKLLIDSAAPLPLRGRVRYAVTTATLTSAGIEAQREDGDEKHVAWDSVVGIIARRLPAEPPYDGFAFVDIVSIAGSTLRILPWTKIEGAPLRGDGDERARAFVNLVAAHCLDAKLDSLSKVFADGVGRPAQLPTAKTLEDHDERLA